MSITEEQIEAALTIMEAPSGKADRVDKMASAMDPTTGYAAALRELRHERLVNKTYDDALRGRLAKKGKLIDELEKTFTGLRLKIVDMDREIAHFKLISAADRSLTMHQRERITELESALVEPQEYQGRSGNDVLAPGPKLSSQSMLDDAARALGWRTDFACGDSPITWEIVLRRITELDKMRGEDDRLTDKLTDATVLLERLAAFSGLEIGSREDCAIGVRKHIETLQRHVTELQGEIGRMPTVSTKTCPTCRATISITWDLNTEPDDDHRQEADSGNVCVTCGTDTPDQPIGVDLLVQQRDALAAKLRAIRQILESEEGTRPMSPSVASILNAISSVITAEDDDVFTQDRMDLAAIEQLLDAAECEDFGNNGRVRGMVENMISRFHDVVGQLGKKAEELSWFKAMTNERDAVIAAEYEAHKEHYTKPDGSNMSEPEILRAIIERIESLDAVANALSPGGGLRSMAWAYFRHGWSAYYEAPENGVRGQQFTNLWDQYGVYLRSEGFVSESQEPGVPAEQKAT